MKAKARENRRRTAVTAALERDRRPALWPYVVAAIAGLFAVFWTYGPALHGAFLFDDFVFPFALPTNKLSFAAPLRAWIGNVRPVLYFTYWLNAQLSGENPYSYHLVNVLIHCVSTGLIFLVVRRLLTWSDIDGLRRDVLSGFAAALFLLHPVQTEAVAYVAGRSEALSVMFLLAAYAVFLYRRETAVTWRVVAGILVLFGLALLSKEQTVVLPALLLLTDYWWHPGFSMRGARSNWRLYGTLALGAVAGVAFFWKLITSAESAGFGLKDFTWYQYFFTQCRALFVYIREFLFPANLTADWDFAISKTILDRGAIVGLLALIGLAALAWVYRRRFPLPSFGFFAFLLLMAPTSSILPIRDAIAERRLYLGIFGLLLITVGLLARLKLQPKVLAAGCGIIALLGCGVAHARAAVWSSPLALWQDTVRKSPDKPRVRFQLGFAYFEQDRPELAVSEFAAAERLHPPAWMVYNLLIDWALSYDSLGQPDQAIAKLRQAALLDPTAHVYSQIAMVYGKRQEWDEALHALATAEKLDPNFAATYLYRGKVFLGQHRAAEAIPQFQRALALDATLEDAARELRRAAQEQQQVVPGAR